MQVQTTELAGVLIFQPSPFVDERGWFSRTFDTAVAANAGIGPFLQDSQSRSHRGVIRGLHLRAGRGEAKLVRCSYGEIYDVVVDLRPDSATYRTWISVSLRDEWHRSIYIPAGCAHGWQALTEPADVHYRIDREHDPTEDVTIRYDDPELGIPWPLPATVVSERDRSAPSLRESGR
jgi:dTDP-4-dehydrorhamnose 3,5-epimerase